VNYEIASGNRVSFHKFSNTGVSHENENADNNRNGSNVRSRKTLGNTL